MKNPLRPVCRSGFMMPSRRPAMSSFAQKGGLGKLLGGVRVRLADPLERFVF